MVDALEACRDLRPVFAGDVIQAALNGEITHELKTALRFLEIRVLDHIIVGASTTTSMAQRGLL